MDKIEELKAQAWQALREVEAAYAKLSESDLLKAHKDAQQAFEQVKMDLAKAEQFGGLASV